jgi:membrane-associated protease RseP (regulator of RpoE activity)
LAADTFGENSESIAPIEQNGPMPVSAWLPPAPRLKFQHRYRTHLLLFGLTLFTTSFAPAFDFFWSAVIYGLTHPLKLFPALAAGLSVFSPRIFVAGLSYSLPLLAILGAHELGHYFLCRRYNVDATLPFFIPLPLPPTGTLGAVIRIREAFPSKRALFDIGVAGPIAGFLMLLPFLFIGISLSPLVRMTDPRIGLHLGDPLLVQAFVKLRYGTVPAGYDVLLHPMAFAAWWGMLATALNLMPFGQLDGGHIVYSILGRRASYASVATVATAALLTFRSLSWASVTIMMLVMAFFLGVRHPRIIDEDTPLDGKRRLVALFAVIMFILCFTPVPIQTFFGK